MTPADGLNAFKWAFKCRFPQVDLGKRGFGDQFPEDGFTLRRVTFSWMVKPGVTDIN